MNKNKYNVKKYLLTFLAILLFSFSIVSCGLTKFNSNKANNADINKMFVHYIDVGQGDCILVQVNNKNLLIDSGPKSDRRKLFNYLSGLNLNKLDYVIATHPHEDHIGNMDDIIKTYSIGTFYSPKVESTTKSFEDMVDALKNKNLKVHVLKNNSNSIDLGENTKVNVFSPNKDFYDNLNNYSPVIKIQYGNTSFLFTGDAEKEVEKEILNNNEDIIADVLKVGHHGSSTSTSKDFLKKVNPSIAVISVGKDNIYNHPDAITTKLLDESNIKTYRTDKDGTIVICSDGSNISKK
ncbi:MAG: MBL fold metallo-hydrolase [Clostridium beijerinckii]|jgi:competence protein ComEC|uniref:ComEC/Rec2 family competence protein n=1 Tax=Clostridium beijerinckii TaxID=1520 RepID=UPI002432F7FF|nr:ComEC/Rec2 family competence protein [Clostridium beijerinckii]MCI1477242.1 MBL fold metallo-hydrolase [Clostridium beijerinckii]MCI1577137.1 MBL fold metallo-hydrolase [Clostridium beijerinckii]MCI1583354.1 MBL fold metallo-hydrolase [Clostridium beijerinckii]MCI1623012.1 MBL fold metallo-hydrolase [Clostridium beijerinckii]MDG5854427.1 ComEC/Rec2 family competence protein [Clostridium beijerinckii]